MGRNCEWGVAEWSGVGNPFSGEKGGGSWDEADFRMRNAATWMHTFCLTEEGTGQVCVISHYFIVKCM